jgi:hypothetical protein
MEEKATASEQPQGHGREPGCLICTTAMPILQKMWSESTRDHFRNSRVEFLKGLRSLIDDRIAYLSREQAKGTKVSVE